MSCASLALVAGALLMVHGVVANGGPYSITNPICGSLEIVDMSAMGITTFTASNSLHRTRQQACAFSARTGMTQLPALVLMTSSWGLKVGKPVGRVERKRGWPKESAERLVIRLWRITVANDALAGRREKREMHSSVFGCGIIRSRSRFSSSSFRARCNEQELILSEARLVLTPSTEARAAISSAAVLV